MPTYIYSKEDFMKFIDEQVKENEVIVFSNETKEASLSKKQGIKIVHQYANDAFKDEGIGHIVFRETTTLGVLIADKDRLSEVGVKAMANIQKS